MLKKIIIIALIAIPLMWAQKPDLSTDVQGILPVANGGTGASTSTGTGAVVRETSPVIATPSITGGTFDFSAATVEAPNGVGRPGTCSVGMVFFDSGETAGVNWYGCTATNVWTLLGGSGGGVADPGANGVMSRTALNVTVGRTLTGDAEASITNGDGVAGNPTFSIGATITRDVEWDTAAEINTATTDDDFVTETGNHTISGTKTITGNLEVSGGVLEIPNSITPPACVPGEVYQDTDRASGQQLMACEGTAFVLQGDGAETNSLETLTTGIATTEIPIGTATDTVVFAALSGDVTMNNAGLVTAATTVVETDRLATFGAFAWMGAGKEFRQINEAGGGLYYVHAFDAFAQGAHTTAATSFSGVSFDAPSATDSDFWSSVLIYRGNPKAGLISAMYLGITDTITAGGDAYWETAFCSLSLAGTKMICETNFETDGLSNNMWTMTTDIDPDWGLGGALTVSGSATITGSVTF